MGKTQTADLAHQIAEQRDRLTESVGAIADKIDTDAIRTQAGAGVEHLLDTATDKDGKPKRGLLVGLVVAVVALLVVRRLAS